MIEVVDPWYEKSEEIAATLSELDGIAVIEPHLIPQTVEYPARGCISFAGTSYPEAGGGRFREVVWDLFIWFDSDISAEAKESEMRLAGLLGDNPDKSVIAKLRKANLAGAVRCYSLEVHRFGGDRIGQMSTTIVGEIAARL